jgi:outer membrane protein, multidrug efflux system
MSPCPRSVGNTPRRRLSGRSAAAVAAGAVLVALLAGCASLQQPAATATLTLPPQWTAAPAATDAATDAAALADWWARFGDPALPPLVEQALQSNTTIAAAQARLRQARAAREGAAAQLAPYLGGSGSAQGAWSDRGGSSDSYRVGLDASWELDLWGGGAAGVRAAEAAEQAGALTLAQTRIAVAAEVALGLLQLRGTQALEIIARRNLASQQQTLQITQWRQEAGLVTQLDVEQARTAVEQTRAQLPALASSAAQTMNALAVLTGRAPGALQAELAWAGETLPRLTLPPALTLAIPAEVLRQRPDVQAAERQLAAADARVEQADAARLPSLSLGGSIGLSALSLGALGSGAGVASLLASVNLPVLDAGRLQAQVRQQEAARDEAAAGYRATVLAALQEVEDTLVSLAGAREQLGSRQAAADSAQRAARLAEFRYASGLVDFQTFCRPSARCSAPRKASLPPPPTLATAHVRLYKALGGGWSPGATETAAR